MNVEKQNLPTEKRKSVRRIRRTYFCPLFLLILAVFLGFGLRQDLQITYLHYKSSKLTEQIRIAFVSDLHSCDYGEDQKDLVKPILQAKPDLVFLTGDIVDDRLEPAKAYALVRQVAAEFPTYYVSGNHEFWSGEIDQIKEQLRTLGVHVLEGDSEEVSVAGQKITTMGVDDPNVGEKILSEEISGLEEEASLATDTVTGGNLRFLLMHRPDLFGMVEKVQADLIFSGHAHGGQWRIPYVLPGVIAPDQGLFPQYTSGFYETSAGTLLVSRGLSRESTRIPRFYNRPELIFVDVVPEEK